MNKKTIIIIAVVAVVVIALAAFVFLGGRGDTPINASHEAVAANLKAAGYTVEVITDEAGLAKFNAQGLTAAVIAYKGDAKLDSPDESKLASYDTVELFYFSSADQAEAYYLTEGFQMGYQAWSDAYYHVDIMFNYHFTENVAFAGTEAALALCA